VAVNTVWRRWSERQSLRIACSRCARHRLRRWMLHGVRCTLYPLCIGRRMLCTGCRVAALHTWHAARYPSHAACARSRLRRCPRGRACGKIVVRKCHVASAWPKPLPGTTAHRRSSPVCLSRVIGCPPHSPLQALPSASAAASCLLRPAATHAPFRLIEAVHARAWRVRVPRAVWGVRGMRVRFGARSRVWRLRVAGRLCARTQNACVRLLLSARGLTKGAGRPGGQSGPASCSA
jgi:hypothetical protein